MFTFSSMAKNASTAKNIKESVDIIKKVEACRNFSKNYSTQHSPQEDITNGEIISVIFKVSENPANQTVDYQFWTKDSGGHTHYSLTFSLKNKDLESITDASGYTLPCSAFKINEQNEVEIVYYGSLRR